MPPPKHPQAPDARTADTGPVRQTVADPELLWAALEALPISIAIFDAQDRQVMRNRRNEEMFSGMAQDMPLGLSFEQVLRRALDGGHIVVRTDDREAWIRERLAHRLNADPNHPILQELAGDRWIHTYEVRTPQGCTVTARLDVTDQVRKERLLAQANEQLARQSATDGLTGVANRRRFDETLRTEWHRAARAGTALSLLIVDIDHFKRYNDHYGHVAGDACLRQVAQLLAEHVRRAGELLARYGGEEFVLLLPGADLERARQMAGRCLERLREQALAHAAAPGGRLSVSIGVAHTWPQADEDPDSIVDAADAAMYRAKSAGRDRFEVAGEEDWPIDKDAPRSRWGDIS